jgi:hypothetical protein
MKHVAYDYAAQQWVEGPQALALIRQQLNEKLELLQSSRGADYAAFAGQDRTLAIQHVRRELNTLPAS